MRSPMVLFLSIPSLYIRFSRLAVEGNEGWASEVVGSCVAVPQATHHFAHLRLHLVSLAGSVVANRRNAEARKSKLLDLDLGHSGLVEALSNSVLLPEDATNFKESMNANDEELVLAVKILKAEYDEQSKANDGLSSDSQGLFAIRGGGHSPIACASSAQGGVLIDTSLFNEVTLVSDRKSVVIGTGCKWGSVYEVLEQDGLAVAGGRNSAVGVGGLSFFSPRSGFVCSNILEYKVVLSDGSVVVASATSSPDLRRAPKGGTNNFGIVTRFTARAFPSSDIWSGMLYMPSSQSSKVLSSFHEFLDRGKTYDEYAAGPLACFTYLQQLGLHAVTVALTHTKSPEPELGLSKIWRLWSTCTIKNDLATLEAAHKAYSDAVANWAQKGDHNVLGLGTCTSEALVNVSFTMNWGLSKDDDTTQRITRAAIEQIKRLAQAQGIGHRYLYINYCDSWQNRLGSYGPDNVDLMREVNRKYDPDGMFQRGSVGDFKLGL
ncbi:hypothetical protein GQ44DRAFT_736596 [Phaeosphaeriaceae sp. PMI808]|nr:hypothetical protein GQ44DRAFT_736596 [Phaeosphaeriaceae sp. PMI808]